jgi:hypothetical protein
MAWRTYTPDGRMLEIEYADGAWHASCDGSHAVGETAAEAITRSLGEAVTPIGFPSSSLDAWIAEQSERLERERDGEAHADGD